MKYNYHNTAIFVVHLACFLQYSIKFNWLNFGKSNYIIIRHRSEDDNSSYP
jgi:hypothetical protein